MEYLERDLKSDVLECIQRRNALKIKTQKIIKNPINHKENKMARKSTSINENSKLKSFREAIRKYVKEILAEEPEKAEPEQDETLVSLQKNIDNLTKATKKVPQELQGKLKAKIKKAQSDIDSYSTPEKEKKK